MAHLILNEWFWADCSGENSTERQKKAAELLLAIVERNQETVFIEGGLAEHKFWALCRNEQSTVTRDIAKIFKLKVLYSTACTKLHDKKLVDLSEPLASQVDDEDKYLVQAQAAVPGSIIISTDNKLLDVLRANGKPCQHRDEFLLAYLAPTRVSKL